MPTGKSEFGEVFLAKAQGLEEGLPETLVLVKSLQSRDEQQQLDFRREFEMFGKLNHANVVRLLGLCLEAEPHYMVLEYVDLVGGWGRPGGSGGGGARPGGGSDGSLRRHREVFSRRPPSSDPAFPYPQPLSHLLAPCLGFGPSFLPASSSAQRQGRLPGPFP